MNDDLEGRQLLALLLFFCGAGGGLYLIGWVTRPSFLYAHPLACAAIAGAACFPARFLAERFSWWSRLAEPRPKRLSDPRPKRRSMRRGFSLVVRILRVITGVLLALGSLAILPVGIATSHDNQNLVKRGPIHHVLVVSVERDKWSKYDDVIVKVARPGDGKPVELNGGNDLQPRPKKGDYVDVVADPSDSTYPIAATVDWSTPWWAYPLMLIATAILFTFGLGIAFG